MGNTIGLCYMSVLDLLCYKAFATVNGAKLRLFDLSRWITRNICKYDLMGSLISGKFLAERGDIILCTVVIFLYGDDSCRYLTQSFVRQPYDRNILDGRVTSEEVLYLNGIKVLAAADYDILLTVNEVNKSVLIFLSHISCIEPAVL